MENRPRLISISRDVGRVNAGTATSVLPFLHGPPYAVNGPVLACFDHAHPRPVSLIDKRVGAKFVTNFRNEEVSSRQPVRVTATSPGQIRQPSSNEVALVVFLNEHRMPRALGALSAQPGRESRAAVSRV